MTVELRHLLRAVAEDVPDDPHRRRRRIDIGVADHELLEDVVLNGPGELSRARPPALQPRRCRRPSPAARRRSWSSTPTSGRAGSDRTGSSCRGSIDRYACLADIAGHPLVIRVVAAVGGQVERDRQALLARRRGCAGRRRWTPRRSRTLRTAGRSTAASRTWSSTGRAGRAGGRRAYSRCSHASRSSACRTSSPRCAPGSSRPAGAMLRRPRNRAHSPSGRAIWRNLAESSALSVRWQLGYPWSAAELPAAFRARADPAIPAVSAPRSTAGG